MCMIGRAVKLIPASENFSVIAYRAFKVGKDYDGRAVLKGSVYSFDYKRITVNNSNPHVRGKTGFWAFKDRRKLSSRFYDCPIVAKVKLSGTIVEHELGYRARKMEILSMTSRVRKVPVVDTDQRNLLFVRYGVTVKV